MKKQFEAAFLLAGTAIGSGMISLPLVLAKFGIVNTCIIMMLFAFLTYLTALVRSDLNLNSRADATLSEIGKIVESDWSGRVGNLFLKLLSFALMSAYIFGLSSIFQSVTTFSLQTIMSLVSIVIFALFICAKRFIIRINKHLFIALFATLLFAIVWLLIKTPIHNVPQQVSHILMNDWATLIPIVFTSFGFQGSIHSMTKFCENNRKMIHNACLWGSIIPAVIYTIWTAAILLIVSNTDAKFFQLMLSGDAIDVGELIGVLSRAASSENIQKIILIVSILAILTSIFGVCTAIIDILNREKRFTKKWQVVVVSVFVPTVVAMFTPNAFIKFLNVSGVVLAVIAIIVPIHLFWKMKKVALLKYKPLLDNFILQVLLFIVGISIIFCGFLQLIDIFE
ncbi:MAG: hypothetical protein K6C34_05020 [Alphaproteobacteria bacterium]|nr:hypothetical protein [Alphaproteobacteria bacterium]